MKSNALYSRFSEQVSEKEKHIKKFEYERVNEQYNLYVKAKT